jgi:acyl-[acyl-carrier-protein]-phospholipid O-acyltransferase / long-chain-fatty-acid--[acyl-carrier-protein] ligase
MVITTVFATYLPTALPGVNVLFLTGVLPGMWADLFGWHWLAILLPILVVALVPLFWPYGALRAGLTLLSHTLFWLRSRGGEHIPARGGALLVANPVSYLGWLLLLAASPRKIHFLVLAHWTRDPGLRRLLRWTGAVTADRASGFEGVDVEDAIHRASALLREGHIVCIFTEGYATQSPTTDPFSISYREVFEKLSTGPSAPIIPVCLQQPHGSLLHISAGKFVRRWPHEFFAPIEVVFAPPLPPGTSAGDVRQALQQLSADVAIARGSRRRPMHRQFVRIAAHRPFRRCFSDSSAPGRDLTYAKAYVAATCLARLLRPILGDEAMVAVWLPPSTGGALANIAIALLGKTSVNLNYTSSPEGIRSALRQCDCKHVLTSGRFTARLPLDPGPGVEMIRLEDLLPKITGTQKLLAMLSVVLLPGWFLEWMLGLRRHRIDDLATVIFSSGSTGDPKGVMLTHGNVVANAESIIQATCFAAQDRALCVLPFFHSFGYTVALWAPLQVGASAVYHADPRQAREIGELCRQHGSTIYLSTATFLRFCIKRCEPDDFRTIRILMCGAEKLPPTLADEFFRRFGVRPLEGYGCTELAPAAAANMPDQVFDGFAQVRNRTGTVGPPLPGVAARIVHPETFEALPIGQEGLLLITGANVMKGYLHKQELTREVIRDGWYVTGDMARLDADGYVTLTGRLSRFAKIGGEMIPLERIEEELHDVLGTTERICAVTCVPDESRGERLIVLYIAAHLTQFDVEVRLWCQKLGGRGLPNLWMPSERDFHQVPELPLLGSGKINLKGVKEMALALVVHR